MCLERRVTFNWFFRLCTERMHVYREPWKGGGHLFDAGAQSPLLRTPLYSSSCHAPGVMLDECLTTTMMMAAVCRNVGSLLPCSSPLCNVRPVLPPPSLPSSLSPSLLTRFPKLPPASSFSCSWSLCFFRKDYLGSAFHCNDYNVIILEQKKVKYAI